MGILWRSPHVLCGLVAIFVVKAGEGRIPVCSGKAVI